MSITIVAFDLDQWAVLWAAQLASKQANGSSPMKRALASTLFTACLFAITDAPADIKDHDLVKDCSAMMGPWPPKTPEDRERLLSQLSSRDHELITSTGISAADICSYSRATPQCASASLVYHPVSAAHTFWAF